MNFEQNKGWRRGVILKFNIDTVTIYICLIVFVMQADYN